MNYFKAILILMMSLQFSYLSSQSISGMVKNAFTNAPVKHATISIRNSETKATTGEDGRFMLVPEENGRLNFIISAPDYESYFSNISFDKTSNSDLGVIKLYPDEELDDKDISELSEMEIAESDESTEVVSLLTASQDVFSRTAAFDFGVARFKVRGYHQNFGEVYINGMPVNDLDDGYAAWSIWGGLNDVMRRRQSSSSMEPSYFAFGGLGGSNHVSTLASDQRKQTRASFSLTNRSYRQRAMLTYSTGMLKSGWAFSFSGSRRWSDEGYIAATFYDAYAYFVSIDKKLSKHHLLNFTFLNSPNERGKRSGAIQEIYDITGSHYYNSYWGYQGNKKRNSRAAKSVQPLATLRHVWNPNNSITINTTLGYQTGRYGSTRLDWYNAADPRPNYYRYLPSYKENAADATALLDMMKNNPDLLQVDWNKMYEINQLSMETIYNVDGVAGNTVTGKMSQYIVEEQRQDPTKLSLNSYIQAEINNSTSLFGGLSYQMESVRNFRVVNDLLGGEFYIDLDKYAERDFPNNQDVIQNDLNHPNRILKLGDEYGYNYEINSSRARSWAKVLFIFNRFDTYFSGEIAYTSFYRNGLYKNGKFPESSFGASDKNNFLTYGIKTGATYKINGRNYLYLNGMYMTRPPNARNAYISPRTRDHVVADLKPEKIEGAELGYVLKSPRLSLKATAYYTQIKDQTKIRSFYHDDESSFVNYILTGIDEVHMGSELAAKYKITPALSVQAVATLGDYYYNSRSNATIAQDNNAEVLTDRTVYMKNFRVNGTPQQAYSLALSYNSPKYWFVNISFNYFDDIYLDFNPERRTVDAIDGLDKEAFPELWNSIIAQEKLPSNYAVNFFGGKSWKIRDYYLYLQLGINNVLNNTNFITGGYEQLRYDFDNRDVNQYPSRYFYAYGLNYYFNLSFRI